MGRTKVAKSLQAAYLETVSRAVGATSYAIDPEFEWAYSTRVSINSRRKRATLTFTDNTKLL